MMEQDQELLIQLVSALRGSNERHVSHLVNMIRSHASLQEIREYITDHLKLGTIEDTSEVTEFRRQIGFLLDVEGPAFESRKAQRVAHPRSLNVPAKPWTVIQCNNATYTFGNNHLARVYEGRMVDALRNFSTSKASASPNPSGNEQQYDNRQPPIEVPQCARPLVFHVDGLAGEQWVPYPNSQPATTSHESCLINSLCNLTPIVNDICLLLSQGWKYLSPEVVDQSVEALFKRLEDWKAHVPSCMRLSDTERSSPQVLGTHVYYHIILISLYGFSQKFCGSVRMSNTSTLSNARARAMRLHAAQDVARLIELRRRLWGLDRIAAPVSQWITISLLTLLEDLSTPESKEAFVSLCVALRVSARRWEYSKGLLRLTQHLALQSCLALPPETTPLYRDFQDLEWGPEDDERFGALAQWFRM
ncbi:hypothetical protein KXV37_004859 [Aspergillus fumigatus]|nr:hypothetical protein KXX64_002102 [Aspergillus fumigatus]KAH1505583.1 hypothetical protein KXX06_009769 [Aspergillus fumigatus]KAH2228513.1 hypothetical protein KXV37_004859 [Aspergillus fumigatus]KAH2260402.1 hypothetical protein KXW72_004734 [Aspergillus fumigatus]KAH2845652.1 hypothetical protein KXV85_009627 [Aspergillus fumigatus]